MKKSELNQLFKSKNADFNLIKKEFSINLKKGENLLNQIAKQITKNLSSKKNEIISILMPKDVLSNQESKMISKSLREDLYDEAKELSLITWELKKAILSDDSLKIDAIIKAHLRISANYNPLMKRLCDAIITDYRIDKEIDRGYIS